MAAVNRAVGKGMARMYWGDSSDCDHPEIRTLEQEISESLFSKLLNPEWIEERMGPVKGEFQGGAVDIKRRGDVKKWEYAFTLDQ